MGTPADGNSAAEEELPRGAYYDERRRLFIQCRTPTPAQVQHMQKREMLAVRLATATAFDFSTCMQVLDAVGNDVHLAEQALMEALRGNATHSRCCASS